jgi:hypothetical protein
MKYKIYLQIFGNRSLLLGITLLFIFTGCSKDVLEETPLDFLAPENAYQTHAGIWQGINGLHAKTRQAWVGGFAVTPWFFGGIGTDVAYFGTTNAHYFGDYASLNAQNGSMRGLWNDSYNLINRANVLIEAINISDEDIWADEAEKNAYLAEAMFFRGMNFYVLAVCFGDVPLQTEVVKAPKTDYVRTPVAEVLNQVKEDLVFAAANLPTRGNEEGPGRITQAVALHKLAEIYLLMDEYQLAVDATSEVIDGGDYALMTERFGSTVEVFGSGDVYLDLHSYGNYNLSENTEGLWVIQYEPFVEGGGTHLEGLYGCVYWQMGNAPDGKKAIVGDLYNGVPKGYSDTLGRGWGYICPTDYFKYDVWRSDWSNDIRNAKHNIKRDFYFDNPESIYDGQVIDFSLYDPGERNLLKDTTSYIFPVVMKHQDPLNHFTEEARSGRGYNHKDFYALRLAETILLRAEAYIELGNPDLAAADINAIRNRAQATPVSIGEVDMDYLLDERARELSAEEWRRFTLLRMGKMIERTHQYGDNPYNPGINMPDSHVLFPIPQSAIDANVDAVLTQNPGYN